MKSKCKVTEIQQAFTVKHLNYNDKPMMATSNQHTKRGLRGKKKWQLVFASYGLLLAISYLVQFLFPIVPERLSEQLLVKVPQKDVGAATNNFVTIAYTDSHPLAHKEPPVILLLHGSPIAAHPTFKNLKAHLTPIGRVIAPDMPGFGASVQSIPEYSIEAHADYMLGFIDRLKISKVHIVAYSMGGGVALHMVKKAPNRIQSLVMLSSIGVQELELLGNYHLNHALHSVQLAALWLIDKFVPHMGLFNRLPVNVNYARNFYDTDQRPLRNILSNLQAPTLILQGRNDAMVPLAAAKEHHRLVPQSEIIVYDGGHMLVLSPPPKMARDIVNFIINVESGEGITRQMATPYRTKQAQKPFDDVSFINAQGLSLIIIMVLIALATLISEDLTCIGAGLLAANGTIGFIPAVVASFSGIFLGDILLFLAGKYLGRPALRHAPLRWIVKETDLDQTAQWFAARGPAIIIASRFLPGSRLPTYFGAGLLDVGFWLFTIYFAIAAALWTPLLVGLATLIGSQLFIYYQHFERYALVVLVGTIAVLWAMIKLIMPAFTFRGRRLLISSLRRKIRWEFWSPFIFYIPVVLYVLYLAIRHRHLTLFTAANPSIPAGGFIGESKSRILDQLHWGRQFIARYRLISGNLSLKTKLSQIKAFIDENALSFPVVLKPDSGQRGKGVAIIKSHQEVATYLSKAEHSVIVQEYVDGLEFGIFYYRYPGSHTGQIFSVTDKRLISLKGDGLNTLENLILLDERAMCMARYHFDKHRQRLHRVPAKGEQIKLVEVGTHCRGALFLNGSHVMTPKLHAVIDHICKGFKGFYFGRFDIRTPDFKSFQDGQNFKIVELNGVTSEATHIYHPGTPIWKAYGVLMNQWKIAFEIGAMNTKNGMRATSAQQLWKLLFN